MTSSNYFTPSGFINIDCLHYNNNIPSGLKYIFKGYEHLWTESCAYLVMSYNTQAPFYLHSPHFSLITHHS